MTNKYKKIILLKGLEKIDEYHFSMIKSLLAHDLELTREMQDNYDRVKIADLMELKFPGITCVNILEELLSDMIKYKDTVKEFRKEKLKVAREIGAEMSPSAKKRKQEETCSDMHGPTTHINLPSEGAKESPVAQKRKTSTQGESGTKRKKVSQKQTQSVSPSGSNTSTTAGFPPLPQTSPSASSSTHLPKNQKSQVQHKGAARRSSLQKGPITVMVLKATEPFEYESPEEGKSTMFHATVVTARQFFQVKVFNTNLKEKFTKQKFITISDYSECKGNLEINKASSVSEAGPDQKFEVPKHIIRRANRTPKIDSLHKQAPGTIVYGLFVLHQKQVNKKNTIYEIQDNTGKMDVLGNGKWHNIECEEGDKLRLFCFQLRTVKKLKLTCGLHSFIQVIKTKKRRTNLIQKVGE